MFTVADVEEDVYRFRVESASPLGDGTVFVAYDLAAESGGDETPPRPRHAVLGADGGLRPLELPTVDGVELAQRVTVLAAGPDGTSFFWDPAGERVVRWTAAGRWNAVVGVDALTRVTPVGPGELPADPPYPDVTSGPAAAGPDGSLYLEGVGSVFRISPDGHVTTLIDVQDARNGAALAVPRDRLPLPADSVTLPELWGMAVGLDGTVYVSTRTEVLAIDDAGIMSLVIRYEDLQTALGIEERLDPQYFWVDLAIDADGSLLASDQHQQLVVGLAPPTILLRHAMLAGNGANATFSAGTDLLVRLLDPDALEGGEQEPDRLAVLGR